MNRAGGSQQRTPTRRLFFALWPERALQSMLAEATHAVVLASKGRAVPVANLHITLAFLGSVPEKDLGRVEGVATRVAAEQKGRAVQMGFDAVEYWKKAQLLCAIARAGQTDRTMGIASVLADALKSQLAAAGFAPDLKPFRAHITLARNVPHRVPTADIPQVHWGFRTFALVESRTNSSGSEYTVLKSFRL